MKPLRWLAALIVLCAFTAPMSIRAATPLPADSLYQLDIALVDQDGHGLRWPSRRGRPVLVSLFYASCPFTCPLLIDTVRKTENALDATQRDGLDVVLVSLDPARDTPTALRQLADKRHVPTPRWTLARAEAGDVRKLAALLGIPYRFESDGSINHASALILLDADGREVARSNRLGEIDADFIVALRRQLGAAAATAPASSDSPGSR